MKILISILICAWGIAFAQNTQQPCSSPEASQFDFWLGEWELTWQGPQGGTPEGQTGRATNHIYRDLGGCVIYENFCTSDSSFIGKSWSVFNPASGEWRQTWVDNSGSFLLFSGKFSDGKMELRMPPREQNGKTIVMRMVFRDIQPNSLNWDWQRSEDGGESWTDVWNIHYERKK